MADKFEVSHDKRQTADISECHIMEIGIVLVGNL
jgi:hypothetical protein